MLSFSLSCAGISFWEVLLFFSLLRKLVFKDWSFALGPRKILTRTNRTISFCWRVCFLLAYLLTRRSLASWLLLPVDLSGRSWSFVDYFKFPGIVCRLWKFFFRDETTPTNCLSGESKAYIIADNSVVSLTLWDNCLNLFSSDVYIYCAYKTWKRKKQEEEESL